MLEGNSCLATLSIDFDDDFDEGMHAKITSHDYDWSLPILQYFLI
jgi:hypothetical protein